MGQGPGYSDIRQTGNFIFHLCIYYWVRDQDIQISGKQVTLYFIYVFIIGSGTTGIFRYPANRSFYISFMYLLLGQGPGYSDIRQTGHFIIHLCIYYWVRDQDIQISGKQVILYFIYVFIIGSGTRIFRYPANRSFYNSFMYLLLGQGPGYSDIRQTGNFIFHLCIYYWVRDQDIQISGKQVTLYFIYVFIIGSGTRIFRYPANRSFYISFMYLLLGQGPGYSDIRQTGHFIFHLCIYYWVRDQDIQISGKQVILYFIYVFIIGSGTRIFRYPANRSFYISFMYLLLGQGPGYSDIRQTGHFIFHLCIYDWVRDQDIQISGKQVILYFVYVFIRIMGRRGTVFLILAHDSN